MYLLHRDSKRQGIFSTYVTDVSFSLKNQLGDVVYVDLPEEGQTFNEGGTIRR